MNSKFSKLTRIFFIGCMTLCLLPQATHAMEDATKAAESIAENALGGNSRITHEHNHKNTFYANFPSGSSEGNMDSLTLRQLAYLGAQRGVIQGTSQVVAQLIVQLAQLGMIKGIEYCYGPTEEQLQHQQQAIAMAQAQKQFESLLTTIHKSGPMVTTLVDGAMQLNEAEAKKVALVALMKYAAQVNMALDINNLQLGLK